MPSKKYRQIVKSVSFLSVLVLLGLFISVGIPYPFLNKDVVHCPVGDKSEEFQLVSTYRKYFHIGMFFKDVRTRSNSSDYKIYFKSPSLWRNIRVPGWLSNPRPAGVRKKYCAYFGKKKGALYFSFPGWSELSISEDGGHHFEKRYPESIVELRRSIYKQATSKHLFDKRRTLIDPPRVVQELAIFPDKAPCTRDKYFYGSASDKRLCMPITVYRIESNDLGRSWTDLAKVEQPELFK